VKIRQIVESVSAGLVVAVAISSGIWKRRRIASHFRGLFTEAEAIVNFSGLLEVFFNEAAVLWFVFPLLDAVYEAKKNEAIHLAEAAKIIGVTWGIALLFFYFAVYFKKLEKTAEKRVAEIDGGKDH
jgi:hypothetical protein